MCTCSAACRVTIGVGTGHGPLAVCGARPKNKQLQLLIASLGPKHMLPETRPRLSRSSSLVHNGRQRCLKDFRELITPETERLGPRPTVGDEVQPSQSLANSQKSLMPMVTA